VAIANPARRRALRSGFASAVPQHAGETARLSTCRIVSTIARWNFWRAHTPKHPQHASEGGAAPECARRGSSDRADAPNANRATSGSRDRIAATIAFALARLN
jgi:hypothetical protein